jgi:hypothetical protein
MGRRTNRAGLAFIACAMLAGPASAQEPIDGRGLVEANCGFCHAIGKNDSSPNRSAPPLRTISQRFSLDELQEMLERGSLFAQHPQMPNFKIGRGAARAITIYLRSIQE